VKLVFGLGNPGAKYEGTRHNIGFLVIDELAQRLDGEPVRRLGEALVQQARLDDGGVLLVKPQTFMNRSGAAVEQVLSAYPTTSRDDLIVVYDDLDLSFGRVRIRPSGSAGGHRGMGSLIEVLGSSDFCRVRVGIGRPSDGQSVIEHVLGRFSIAEQAEIERVVDRAALSVICLVQEGLDRAMGQFNAA
jgi:PTH1 family peptidyl-tRNA hydrolase